MEKNENQADSTCKHCGQHNLQFLLKEIWETGHNLHQPLTSINNYAQAAHRLIEDTDVDLLQLQGILTEISRLAHQAGDLSKKINSFSTNGRSSNNE